MRLRKKRFITRWGTSRRQISLSIKYLPTYLPTNCGTHSIYSLTVPITVSFFDHLIQYQPTVCLEYWWMVGRTLRRGRGTYVPQKGKREDQGTGDITYLPTYLPVYIFMYMHTYVYTKRRCCWDVERRATRAEDVVKCPTNLRGYFGTPRHTYTYLPICNHKAIRE